MVYQLATRLLTKMNRLSPTHLALEGSLPPLCHGGGRFHGLERFS